jgi:hypothetical protein
MKNLLLLNVLLFSALLPSAFAQDPVPSGSPDAVVTPGQQSANTSSAVSPKSYLAWKISLVPVVASQTLDAYSSYGLRELNPDLAGSGGRFDERSALLKAGITGALIGVEYLLVRKHRGSTRLLWKLNIVSSAITGGVAAHNFSLR